MLSTDLVELYGVQPRALVQAVKLEIKRFPGDFMFQLSGTEVANVKSQDCDFKVGAVLADQPPMPPLSRA